MLHIIYASWLSSSRRSVLKPVHSLCLNESCCWYICVFAACMGLFARVNHSDKGTQISCPLAGEQIGPWFLFALFAVILVWEEVWDLPQNAALSAWLLLLITAGAMACSAVFERRYWCRFLCPIGGMNALFAKLSMTELRAKPGVCSSEPSCFPFSLMYAFGRHVNLCVMVS